LAALNIKPKVFGSSPITHPKSKFLLDWSSINIKKQVSIFIFIIPSIFIKWVSSKVHKTMKINNPIGEIGSKIDTNRFYGNGSAWFPLDLLAQSWKNLRELSYGEFGPKEEDEGKISLLSFCAFLTLFICKKFHLITGLPLVHWNLKICSCNFCKDRKSIKCW